MKHQKTEPTPMKSDEALSSIAHRLGRIADALEYHNHQSSRFGGKHADIGIPWNPYYRNPK